MAGEESFLSGFSLPDDEEHLLHVIPDQFSGDLRAFVEPLGRQVDHDPAPLLPPCEDFASGKCGPTWRTTPRSPAPMTSWPRLYAIDSRSYVLHGRYP